MSGYYCVVSRFVNNWKRGLLSQIAINKSLQQNSLCVLKFSKTCSNSSKNFSSSTTEDDDKKDKKDKSSIVSDESNNYDPKEDEFFTQETAYGAKENKGLGEPLRPYFSPSSESENVVYMSKVEEEELLEPPTNCCRSGCPNCVWIDYVEKLSKKYSNPELSREKILKDLELMDDESIKAFIKLELRSKGLL